jgi:hypothetical protein
MEMTINEFIRKINEESDGMDSKLKKIIFNITTDVREMAIRNIDARLNKYGRAKGGLRNSVLMEVGEDGIPQVSAGGVGVPYAAAQEFGATIIPKNVQWLTIPATDEAFGKKATEFGDLKFRLVNPQLAMLFRPTTNEVLFWLKKQVTIVGQNYLQDAGDGVMEKQSDYVKELFSTSDVWSVS